MQEGLREVCLEDKDDEVRVVPFPLLLHSCLRSTVWWLGYCPFSKENLSEDRFQTRGASSVSQLTVFHLLQFLILKGTEL